MNHIEALKVARDALEEIRVLAVSREGHSRFMAIEALAATAVIEPVAASIDTLEFNSLISNWGNSFICHSGIEEWSLVIEHINQHCAAQVAQALAAAPSFTAVGATFHCGGGNNPVTYSCDSRGALVAKVDLSGWTCYAPGAQALAAKPAPSGQSDEISRSQPAAQTVDESPQTRMDAHSKPLVSVGVERELVARDALTDAEIVEVLHSLGIDTYPSKYNFPEVQVSSTNIPLIRRVVESCIARLDSRVTAVIDPQPSTDDGRSDVELKMDEAAAPFEKFLTESDMYCLNRFMQCCEDSDSGGHDVSKEEMRRLTEIGVVRSCGFGRHEATAFGSWVYYGAWFQETTLPLMTMAEANAAAAMKDEK